MDYITNYRIVSRLNTTNQFSFELVAFHGVATGFRGRGLLALLTLLVSEPATILLCFFGRVVAFDYHYIQCFYYTKSVTICPYMCYHYKLVIVYYTVNSRQLTLLFDSHFWLKALIIFIPYFSFAIKRNCSIIINYFATKININFLMRILRRLSSYSIFL